MNTNPSPVASKHLRIAAAFSLLLFTSGLAILWTAVLAGTEIRSIPVYIAAALAALGMFSGATTRMLWPTDAGRRLPAATGPATSQTRHGYTQRYGAIFASALTLAAGAALLFTSYFYGTGMPSSTTLTGAALTALGTTGLITTKIFWSTEAQRNGSLRKTATASFLTVAVGIAVLWTASILQANLTSIPVLAGTALTAAGTAVTIATMIIYAKAR